MKLLRNTLHERKRVSMDELAGAGAYDTREKDGSFLVYDFLS